MPLPFLMYGGSWGILQLTRYVPRNELEPTERSPIQWCTEARGIGCLSRLDGERELKERDFLFSVKRRTNFLLLGPVVDIVGS